MLLQPEYSEVKYMTYSLRCSSDTSLKLFNHGLMVLSTVTNVHAVVHREAEISIGDTYEAIDDF